MNHYITHIKLLFKRLGLILVLFSISRLIFWIFNYQYFQNTQSIEILKSFFWGIRFDFIVVFYINVLFIILHLIPGKFKDNSFYQIFKKVIFQIINSVAIYFNFVDCEFFKFTNKRITTDLFRTAGFNHDFLNLLPKYLIDFWYLLLIWIVCCVVMWILYPKLKTTFYKKLQWKGFIFQPLIGLSILGIFFIIARGLKLKPIRIISAVEYVKSENTSLLINTPFAIINTYRVESIKSRNYFTDDKLSEIYTPQKKYSNGLPLKKQNVVVIILESFSKEYIGALNRNHPEKKDYKGYTPFLDSLMEHSLTFTNAYANGKNSIKALSSVLASLPPIMNEDFISSRFATNKIHSISGLLKKEGYHTSFFHGGNNGTMGFNSFAKCVEIENYYGRSEFNNDEYFDGDWGIIDDAFLQFFVDKLDTFKEPFFSSIFTLSSHHPYYIPDRLMDKFKDIEIPLLRSVKYADYSLQQFFAKASTMKWYDNTLFVLCADHTSLTYDNYYKNNIGKYAIPILFYNPSDPNLVGFNDSIIVQQSDIMPSILDYLNYSDDFIAFGESVFKKENEHFAINHSNNMFQLLMDEYAILFDGEKTIGLYNYKLDRQFDNNLEETLPDIKDKMEQKIKAIIQSYNNRMINNKLTLIDK